MTEQPQLMTREEKIAWIRSQSWPQSTKAAMLSRVIGGVPKHEQSGTMLGGRLDREYQQYKEDAEQ